MTPQEQRQAHMKKCTLVRQGAVVRDAASGNIEFDGFNSTIDFKQFGSIPCRGINAAKRYVRKSGQLTFNNTK